MREHLETEAKTCSELRIDLAAGPGICSIRHMYQQISLSRSLRSRHVAMISIGGIIGAGLFVGSSASIAVIGPAVICSYAIAGLLIFLSMRMLGELALANPEVGFFTDYARKVLGHPWGFVGGWL